MYEIQFKTSNKNFSKPLWVESSFSGELSNEDCLENWLERLSDACKEAKGTDMEYRLIKVIDSEAK